VDAERWQKVEDLYRSALNRQPDQRAVFLDEACGQDAEMRREVESLLAYQPKAQAFLETPVMKIAAAMTGDQGGSLVDSVLGSYRVVALLGRGGMGEVYRARDTRLSRDVALKVLPPALAEDQDRLARFRREAKLLASLNHPHIAAIYGLEEADHHCALVLELVEGTTLAERLARGALPLDRGLATGRQIAEALEAAHTHNIIHRDLKPANIKITPDGVVKVLDFGLAKTVDPAAAGSSATDDSPTSVSVTGEGVICGTAAYMSPEQARGQRLDRRTDIWAFGCVLYEMLTGRSAFAGKTLSDTIAKVLECEPTSIRQLRRDVPTDVERLVKRCLEKDADARYSSATELLSEIEKCEKRLASRANAVITALNRPAVAISIIAILIAAAIAMWFWIKRTELVRWARSEGIPQIEMYAEAGDWEAAYGLAKKVQEVIPNDPALSDLWPRFSWLITIPSDPPGAQVFRRAYSASEDNWEELGTTPLERIHLPFGYSVVRVDLPGRRPLVRALGFTTEGSQQLMRLDPLKLDTSESAPEGKVRVSGRPPEFGAFDIPAPFRDFFLGQHEVTNREYKRFVDAGGYRRREFWEHPLIQDGKEISLEQAITLFTDKTGRSGPSTWEAGDYPEGRGEYPVSGVSWYEAAAYARFAGQELPTIHHWRFALTQQAPSSVGSEASWLLPASNLDADGPAPVGQFKGIAWSGAYDMIGNAREWCFNAIGNKRVIAGGGWNDESAFYNPAKIEAALPPLDRSAANGFRLAITNDDPGAAARLRSPLPEITPRDLASEKPVSNEAFEIYRSIYAYDPLPLNAKIEATDSSRNWIRERVSFDSSYGERTVVYLYLPRTGSAPYQTLLYSPGGVANFVGSIDQYRAIHLDFILKSGRAVAFPILKGTFERRDKTPLQGPNARRQRISQTVNDLRRTMDYLATRKEIDSTKIGYYGYSTFFGPMYLVVERRLRAAVFYLAGLPSGNLLPEVDPLTFLPRAAVPVLMFSGELDSVFPLETSAKPFFRLLRTPDKQHRIAPGGHFVPREIFIRETLDWFDRYLGAVKF
jgi:serine/threonine protein kinase/pimeloyl-ACP methyl ester carboxylesterase